MEAEWLLLQSLAAHNPARLCGLQRMDMRLEGILHGPSACAVSPAGVPGIPRTDHVFHVRYPVHFPAVPMELYLATPVQHPNIHPETGFVCLWDRHRVSHTVEHALHKLVAMLLGRLYNETVPHVMQPEALNMFRRAPKEPAAMREALLRGVEHAPAACFEAPRVRKQRLR